MDMVKNYGQIILNLMVILRMDLNMVMVYIFIPMGVYMKEIGLLIKWKVL